MATQPSGRSIDPLDIGLYWFGVLASRQHEMAVVGPRAPEIIHHEIAAVRLDGLLEPLHGRQQIREIIRTLGAGYGDAAAPQPVGNLGGGGGARVLFFAICVSHALFSLTR